MNGTGRTNRRPAAEFKGVSKHYRPRWWGGPVVRALDGVTLTIPAGCVFGLLGPNRAGKTTLLKVLLGLCRPTSGAVRRLGRSLRDRSTLGRIGYLHDSQAFPRYLSARRMLEFYGAMSGLSRAALWERIDPLLERVGLADRARDAISGYSKGMLQRLALAQALLADPELLVMDEPGEGMDLPARDLLCQVLNERRLRGLTSLLVSHGLPEIQALCDQAAVLRAGRVVFSGSLSELNCNAAGAPQPIEESLRELYEAAVP